MHFSYFYHIKVKPFINPILWLCTLATTDVIPSDAKLEGPEKAKIQTVQLLLLYLDEHTLL